MFITLVTIHVIHTYRIYRGITRSRVYRAPLKLPRILWKKRFFCTYSFGVLRGGLVGSGVRLRLLVCSLSGPASSRSPRSFRVLNTAPTYTERSTLVYCRQCSATLALTSCTSRSRDCPTIPECTALCICRRSIQARRGKAGIGVYHAPTILP